MKKIGKSLSQAVSENPFPDYQQWWPMGRRFTSFMSDSIVACWSELNGNDGALEAVTAYCVDYIAVVFGSEATRGLVRRFVNKEFSQPIQSGEFDALSYAFYRVAFELIAAHRETYANSLATERRLFTKRVGRRFFDQLHNYLDLNLPSSLTNHQQFSQLQANIDTVGAFLVDEGYLRDHFDFSFDVDIDYGGRKVSQEKADFLDRLYDCQYAYALYEMGYPAILPSAAYLYDTIGEAQHHSSRTIEELFERIGYNARETDGFDPRDYSPDLVIELWKIRKHV